MTLEEKIINIVGDKGIVTNRGNLSSGNDYVNSWYENYDIKLNDNPDKTDNKHWKQIFQNNFSNRKIFFSSYTTSCMVSIENSIILQRKEKLKRLQS